MAELWAMSACELARLVRAREVSAREVVEAHLDRIGQVNPALNAVTVLLAADALRAAVATPPPWHPAWRRWAWATTAQDRCGGPPPAVGSRR